VRPSETRAADPRLASRLRSLRPTRALIDLDAIAANFHYLRERAGPADVLCVVKANAYGHGAPWVAHRLEREGASWFGVAVVEEGVELREAGVLGRILLLGGCEPEQLELALRHDMTPTVVSPESFEALADRARRTGARLRCHLKIDTGMTRLGLAWNEIDGCAGRLAAGAPLEVEGLLTHLACSDDPAVPFTRVQLERFQAARDRLAAAGVRHPLVHVASSAGLLTRAEREVELVRPGVALYGLNPFGNARAPELSPAFTLTSRVVRVLEVPAGTAVGYGSAFITTRASRLATIPVGYDDGLRRSLSGKWEVAVRGRRAPLVGRISMDLVVADVTELAEAATGDDVVLVGGGDDEAAHSVEEMAQRLDTIPYEITTGISGRVPRLLLEAGEVVAVQSRFEHLGGLVPAADRAGAE
jgi:alanine racemase